MPIAPVHVIAEAGVNHNGKLELAMELIDVAAQAGADSVKFQTFRADALASESAPKANYQIRETGSEQSQQEMLKSLELDEAAHRKLLAHCNHRGVQFLSSPFDHESLRFLAQGLGLGTIKLGSGELTNGPLILAAANLASHLIISTGMATIGEVEDALAVVAYADANPGQVPNSLQAVKDALAGGQAMAGLRDRVTLLHCTTEYPAPPESTNLHAMTTLSRAFGLPVGYSDHTFGSAITLAAVALGATTIEKHFTLDRGMDGPDHAASLEPSELTDLVNDIRRITAAAGSGVKQPAACELSNRIVARKTMVASTSVPKGAQFEATSIAIKRHGAGLSPMHYWDVLGRHANRDYAVNDVIVD